MKRILLAAVMGACSFGYCLSIRAADESKPAEKPAEAVVEKPRSHCAYFTLGVAFADAGLYRDAIRAWQKVVEYAPESAEAVSARESNEVLTKYLTGQAN